CRDHLAPEDESFGRDEPPRSEEALEGMSRQPILPPDRRAAEEFGLDRVEEVSANLHRPARVMSPKRRRDERQEIVDDQELRIVHDERAGKQAAERCPQEKEGKVLK